MSQVQHAIFKGIGGSGGHIKLDAPGVKIRYPNHLYKDGCDPITVNNTDEEIEARKDGYDSITASAMANPYLINWFWDLEDMSPKQLRVFAKEAYNVTLPEEATQDTLFKAVIELTRNAPQNKNRLILMAHTIKMNYDATIEEIKRRFKPGARDIELITEKTEVWA